MTTNSAPRRAPGRQRMAISALALLPGLGDRLGTPGVLHAPGRFLLPADQPPLLAGPLTMKSRDEARPAAMPVAAFRYHLAASA
jgi:hypothetical protein